MSGLKVTNNTLGRKKINLCSKLIGGNVVQAFMGGSGFPPNVAVCIVNGGDKDGVWFAHLKENKAIQFLSKGKIKISRIKGQYKRWVSDSDDKFQEAMKKLDEVYEQGTIYMTEEENQAYKAALHADLT